MNDTVNSINSELEVQKTQNDSLSQIDSHEDPSASAWHKIRQLSPFVKKCGQNGAEDCKKLRIISKNTTSEEMADWLMERVLGREVKLSHTPSISGQSCRGIVSSVEFQDCRIEMTFFSEAEFPIWEDTDIWILPMHLDVPQTSSCMLSLLAETTTLCEPDETLKLESRDVFGMINGWRYVSGVFERIRRKYGSKWENVYLTELKLTPVDQSLTHLLELIEEKEPLKFSEDIEEEGDVLMEVSRKNIEERTITVGITGFLRGDVDISLLKDRTYYLTVDKDDDDVVSMSSETSILSGYKLVPNIDELCEKIGEVSITQVSIKVWYAIPNNVPFIRLVLTNHSNRKLVNFKVLVGYHIVIRNVAREREEVVAVVNKVLKDEMIVTLRAYPRGGKHAIFSKEERFTVHIDHEFEERTLKFTGNDGLLESIRRELIHDPDIRFSRSWMKVEPNGKKKKFASFTYKNPAIGNIPYRTKVLLGKCWEVDGILERKADFVFAIRVEDQRPRSTKTIVFEIKFTKQLVHNAPEFKLSDAFYFIEFDFTDSISSDSQYGLYDARCCSRKHYGETVRSSHPINDRIKFQVIDYRVKQKITIRDRPQESEKPKQQSRSENSQTFEKMEKLTDVPEKPTDLPKPIFELADRLEDIKIPDNVPEEFTSNSELRLTEPIPEPSEPSSPESGFIDEQKTAFPPPPERPMITKQKRLCFAYLSQRLAYDSEFGNPIVKLRVGFDENGEKIKMKRPLNIGSRVVLTGGVEHKEIMIRGQIQDTSGENVVLMVEWKNSDHDFLRLWKPTDNLPLYEDL